MRMNFKLKRYRMITIYGIYLTLDRSIIITLLILTSCKNMTQRENDNDLIFRPTANSKYQYTITNERSIRQTLDEKQINQLNDNNFIDFFYSIDNKNDNSFDCTVHFNSFSKPNKLYEAIVERGFDVSKAFEHSLNAFENLTLRFQLNKSGRVNIMNGYDEFRSKIDRLFFDQFSPDDNSISPSQVVFTEEYFRQIISERLAILPESPVSVNSSWINFEKIILMEDSMQVEIGYTLKHIKSGIAYVTCYGEFSKKLLINGYAPMWLKGTQSGSFNIEIGSGILLKSEITRRFNGQTKLGQNIVLVEVADCINVKGHRIY